MDNSSNNPNTYEKQEDAAEYSGNMKGVIMKDFIVLIGMIILGIGIAIIIMSWKSNADSMNTKITGELGDLTNKIPDVA